MQTPVGEARHDPAAVWNAGGREYDKVGETIADAIEHCVVRLNPQSGERVLDVATGTGWAARRVAARGARVTGVDFGPDLIEAAKAQAAAARLSIDFQVGNAEQLKSPSARGQTPQARRSGSQRAGVRQSRL